MKHYTEHQKACRLLNEVFLRFIIFLTYKSNAHIIVKTLKIQVSGVLKGLFDKTFT
jgi:hypothetical protein